MGTRSKPRYYATCVLGFWECLLYGGLKFGWASLVYVLKDLRYFNVCIGDGETTKHTWRNHSDAMVTHSMVDQQLYQNISRIHFNDGNNGSQQGSCGTFWLCTNQDSCLHLVFTVAPVACGIIMIPVGIIVDRFSIRIPRLMFSILVCSSLLMLALSTPDTSQLIFPSIAGMSMGGLILIVANMQIGNLFISRRSTVIAIYNGAIDSSGIVLLIVKLCYEYYSITLQTSCLTLLGISIILFIVNTLLLPRHRIVWPPPSTESKSEGYSKVSQNSDALSDVQVESPEKLENAKHRRRKSIHLSEKHKEAIKYPTIKRALVSPLFICIVLWLSVFNLRDLYFLGTFHSWIEQLVEGDHTKVSHYTNIVTLVQCSGVLIAPVPGLLMDRNKGKKTNGAMDLYEDLQDSLLVLVLTSTISVLFSVFVIIPIETVQYVSFLLHIGMRSFMYAAVGAFIPIAFPTKYYGTMFCVTLAAANLFSLLQYPLFLLGQGPLQGNHYYLNCAFIVVCLLTFSFPLYVYVYVKRRETLVRRPCKIENNGPCKIENTAEEPL